MKNAADMMPNLPEVKFTKSGYEIRADILGFAKDFAISEYESKFNGWKLSVERDSRTNQVLTTVQMPQFPGLDQILETAKRMYEFVDARPKSKTEK